MSFPRAGELCRAMSLITKGFLRAFSRCWYPAGRWFTSSLEPPSWGHSDGKVKECRHGIYFQEKLLFVSILLPFVRRVSGEPGFIGSSPRNPASNPQFKEIKRCDS